MGKTKLKLRSGQRPRINQPLKDGALPLEGQHSGVKVQLLVVVVVLLEGLVRVRVKVKQNQIGWPGQMKWRFANPL